MSLSEYAASHEIRAAEYSFNAIIMAAMRRAGPTNRAKLHREWPGVWEELEERDKAPGGYLEPEEMKENPRQRP